MCKDKKWKLLMKVLYNMICDSKHYSLELFNDFHRLAREINKPKKKRKKRSKS